MVSQATINLKFYINRDVGRGKTSPRPTSTRLAGHTYSTLAATLAHPWITQAVFRRKKCKGLATGQSGVNGDSLTPPWLRRDHGPGAFSSPSYCLQLRV